MATFTLQDEEILRRAVATGEAGGERMWGIELLF